MQTQGHPNATAAAVTTALAYVLLRVDQHYHWLGLSEQSALLIAGGAITFVLFVGRRGILPMLSTILHGSAKAVTGPPDPPPLPPPLPLTPMQASAIAAGFDPPPSSPVVPPVA